MSCVPFCCQFRGNIDALRAVIPNGQWDSAMHSCEQAARCFPNSLYMGIDLLFTPGFRSHAIIEVNAFGDLLPNVLHQGLSTYEAELATIFPPAVSSRDFRSHGLLARDALDQAE